MNPDAINLRIEPGQLVGVMGLDGSSKSPLLMAVLRGNVPESLGGMAAAVEGAGAANALKSSGEVRTAAVRAPIL